MARAPQRSRGGPGSVGMLVFLVLAVILAGVCVVLGIGYLKRGASLAKLQSEIKRDLEDPLGKSLGVSAQPVASASDVAYDDAFFNKIQKSASDGMNYAKLVEKVGYTGENPINEITAELQKTQPEPESLHDYVTKLIQDLGAVQRQLNERNQALQLATAQTKDAQNLQAQESADLKATLDKSAKDLQDARDAYDKDLAIVEAVDGESGRGGEESLAENHAEAEMPQERDRRSAGEDSEAGTERTRHE